MEVTPPGAIKIKSPDGKVYEVPLRRSDGIYFVRLNDVWEFYAKATGLAYKQKNADGKEKTIALPRKFERLNENRSSEAWAVNIYAPDPKDLTFWTNHSVFDIDTTLRLDGEIDFLMGISFSGGGARAAAFHIGAFQRLNEVGFLRYIDTFTGVSGGSLALAFLAVAWEDLAYCDFDRKALLYLVIEPLRQFLKNNFAAKSLFSLKELWEKIVNKKKRADRLAAQYERGEIEAKEYVKKMPLFQEWKNKYYPDYDFPSLNGVFGKPLSEALVDPGVRMLRPKEKYTVYEADHTRNQAKASELNPFFVFCGMDVRTGRPFYFTQRTVGPLYDEHEEKQERVYHRFKLPLSESNRLVNEVKLCQALAASSAFPVIFAPLELNYKSDLDGEQTAYVADGGIYDNIGTDPFDGFNRYKKLPHMMIMVSDAGSPVVDVEKPSTVDIVGVLTRDIGLLIDQTVRLRKKQLKKKIALELMDGAIWSLEDIWDYYYAIYYDVESQSKKNNNTNHSDTKIHSPSSAQEFKQCALSDQHFDSLSDFLKKPMPEGFPNLAGLFDLKNLESFHKGLAQITSFRTDLDALSDAETEILEMVGYTLSAYSILRYSSDRFKGVKKVDPAKRFAIERYEHAIQLALKTDALKHSDNILLSFFLNNLPSRQKNQHVANTDLMKPIFDAENLGKAAALAASSESKSDDKKTEVVEAKPSSAKK